MPHDPIVIVSYARTPLGNLLGELKTFSAHALGTQVIKALVTRAGLSSNDIDEVILGCVLPAGQGQAPARQAALRAGLQDSTPCTTINKVCGSGMKAIMLAHDILSMGNATVMVAGGMESMTNAPYLLLKARQGYRFGQSDLYDHMTLDGLEDAYETGKAMGLFADECAKQLGISRKQQDDFALLSFARAQKATQDGAFSTEIVPLSIQTKSGSTLIDKDERPFSVNPERIPTLTPAFIQHGTVTAGNSSSISDGAAGLILMRLSEAEKRGLTPIASIIGHHSFATSPDQFTIAPIDATRRLVHKINWSVDSIDLFEVNEAFSIVALAFMDALNIPIDKVNIHGGACALGHPIGASGARIVVTLLSALQQKKLRRGLATLCIGGGEATALAIELY